jgi:hypothetical protein
MIGSTTLARVSVTLELVKSFVELTKGVAWPLAVLAIAILFRKEIRRLLRRLTKLKYKEAEAEFSEMLLKAQADAPEVLSPPEPETEEEERHKRIFAELAARSPRSAVLEAWREVESALREAVTANRIKLSDRDMISPRELIRALEGRKLIDLKTARLLYDLRALRNEAAHAPDAEFGTTQGALDYAALATRVLDLLPLDGPSAD